MKKITLTFCLLFCLNFLLGQNLPLDSKNVVCNCFLEKTIQYYSNSDGYFYDDPNKSIKENLANLKKLLFMDNDSVKKTIRTSREQVWRQGRFEYDDITVEDYSGYFSNINNYYDKIKYHSGGYLLKREYEKVATVIPSTIGVSSSWVREDVGTFLDLIIKTPFDTYINESKNFDVMFGLKEVSNCDYSRWNAFIVVKNYFKQHEYNSLSKISLIIGDEEISLTETYDGFGSKYREQKISITSNRQIIAYRTVIIHRFDLNYIMYQKNKNKELMNEYLNTLIKKMQSGKVFICYETSTGKINRTFTDAQIISFKEMLKIYQHFMINKNNDSSGLEYKNDMIKQVCEDLEIENQKYKDDFQLELIAADSIIKHKTIQLINKYNEKIYNEFFGNFEKNKESAILNITDTLFQNYFKKITIHPIKTQKIPKSREYEPVPAMVQFHKSYENISNHVVLNVIKNNWLSLPSIFNGEDIQNIFNSITKLYFTELESNFNLIYNTYGKGKLPVMEILRDLKCTLFFGQQIKIC